MKRFAIAIVVCSAFAAGDGGILVPTNLAAPNPNALTMSEMAVDITIDDGDARVLIRQVYSSHVGQILEGKYTFALPGRATISDFAVWDGVTRIPGVILERKRADEIYKNLKWQSIDPGLLKTGEDEAEGRRSAVFSAEIVPIPPYGSKRVEIEYHQTIPVDDLASVLAIPLKPDAYQQQSVGHFWITLELHSSQALKDFQIASKAYGVQVREQNPHLVRATLEARNVNLTEDFSVRYAYDAAAPGKLNVIAHRDSASEPGFFQASGLLVSRRGDLPPFITGSRPYRRSIVVLFDNSLSMQWEKLERSFMALDSLLHALIPEDHFNVLMFNSQVEAFGPTPVKVSSEA